MANASTDTSLVFNISPLPSQNPHPPWSRYIPGNYPKPYHDLSRYLFVVIKGAVQDKIIFSPSISNFFIDHRVLFKIDEISIFMEILSFLWEILTPKTWLPPTDLGS